MELTKDQSNALQIAVKRFKENKPYTTIAGFAGTGKAQPVDTLIPTPNGTKLLGEIKVGDYVFDRLGKPTKVLGVYPQGLLDCYQVTLADGRKTYCNDEHLWSYCGRKIRNKNKLYTKSLREILNDKNFCYKYENSNSCIYKYHIPTSHAIEYKEKQYNIDPYVVGVFLGDGCCLSKYLTLSSNDEEIVKEISKLIGAIRYHKNSKHNYNWTFILSEDDNINHPYKTSDLFENYPTICNYSYNKDIPDEYMNGSIEQRIALIQGLMDTDGCIQRSGGRYNVSFTSTSINLIKSVQTILFSLGYSSSIHEDKREKKYTNGTCYKLHIYISNSEKHKLFRLKRKKDIALEAKDKKEQRDYSSVSIVDIQKCDYKKEMVCIYVDNSEHLYLTNDYIVTHNTTLVKYIIEELGLSESDVVYIAYTGRASLVLKNKGCKNAMTAHRLLYNAKENPDGTFDFTPKSKLDENYKLIVLDESSMFPEEMWELLLGHRVHVLALGDNGQLPPVGGNNTILNHPHAVLNEIVRQALESPIIRLSMDIRNGKWLEYGGPKECRVISHEEVTDKLLLGADIILAGKNITRHSINEQVRHIKFGDKYQPYPLEGDKVVCLKNQWNALGSDGNPLVNGVLGHINNISFKDTKKYKPKMTADFTSDNNGFYKKLHMDRKIFVDKEPTINKDNWKEYAGAKRPYEFDYGYCITVHRSQGSEFERVLVFDEWLGDKEYHKRWLYTAATRSSSRLIIVK